MLRIIPLLLVGLLALPSCTHPPPNLSPTGAAAFQKTRVIKGLDLLRDFAIDGEATNPKVVSTDTTRTIVQAHQSILRIMDAAGNGWQALVSTSLDEALTRVKDSDRAKVAPYVALVKAILAEVH